MKVEKTALCVQITPTQGLQFCVSAPLHDSLFLFPLGHPCCRFCEKQTANLFPPYLYEAHRVKSCLGPTKFGGLDYGVSEPEKATFSVCSEENRSGKRGRDTLLSTLQSCRIKVGLGISSVAECCLICVRACVGRSQCSSSVIKSTQEVKT